MSVPLNKLFSLISVLVIVAISGCTTGGGGATVGPGVVILSWVPELPNIFSGDSIDLLLKVQNQGESRARNVIAELSNIDLSEWGSFGQQQLQLGDLIARDPVTSTPGETKTIQFQNLKAPIHSRGTSFPYQPEVRVSYDYTTTGQKPITLVDRNELIRIQQQGKTLPSKPTTFTSGPLSVEIVMGNFVKTSGQFNALGQSFDIFPVQIKITNTLWSSGGTVIPFGGFGGSGAGSFGTGQFDYPVRVKVTPPAGTNFISSGYADDCSSSQFTVDLFQGSQGEVTCELEVSNPPTFRTESLIQAELDYRYLVVSQTQIIVQGTRELGGGFGGRI